MTTRAFACALVLTAVVGVRAAQSQGGSASVALSQSVGPAGGEAAVPIQLTAEGIEIGSLTLTVHAPAGILTFDRLVLGGLSEGVGAEGSASARVAGDETVIDVTIATPEKDGARTPIPNGPLGDLLFKVDAHAKPETGIPLQLQAAAKSARGNATVKVAAKNGEVIVGNPPVGGCFFYMH